MLTALIISVMILFVAPLFCEQLQDHVDWRQAMDGFVVVSVLGIIAFSIMPAVLESDISYIPLIFLLGLAMPTIAESLLKGSELGTHRLTLFVPAFAMVLHALGDGSVLKLIEGDDHASGIAIGMILHRFGLGASIWWMMINTEGRRGGLIFVSLIALATILGYGFTSILLGLTVAPEIELVQAFAAGSLLHILLHPLNHNELNEGRGRGRHRLGSLLGGLLVVAIIVFHLGGHPASVSGVDTIASLESADAFDRLISFGAGISPILLALMFSSMVSHKLRFLGPLSLVIWLLMFAFVPVSILPDLSIGRYILVVYAAFLILFMTRFGGRSAIAFILPKHIHIHDHDHKDQDNNR